ncbi:hypothetical protein HFO98_18070 [Rhizobium leguminosarum]|uniref:hypothetical protein n=1 Tax=Rhizobium leguminosarum TaxID=384 RepID=UPI001C9771C8|nr:hypothetical protein [Rhizobium leguminosarum]MBY5363029.1 hypothetical protein [Rhizobium leguminosarum]MBY5410335.1 hypothetical protein [Rhizobium leguminosarum]
MELRDNKKAPSAPPPQAAEPSAPDSKIVANDWAFSRAEEDCGEARYAKTQVGDVKVGFMGAPGKDLVGCAFTGDVHVTWEVDKKGTELSEGCEDDYFDWHSFYGYRAACSRTSRKVRSGRSPNWARSASWWAYGGR